MLTEHVTIARRFQRSIRLDTDLARADALQGFVCQRSAADGLLGMAGQIAQTTQRAFTWTGPYGGGKSSLAIVLAGLLGPKGGVRSAAAASLGPETTQQLLKIFKPTPDGWLIIPVVGRRDDPVADIAGAFEQARRRDGAVRGRPRREVQTADALFGLEHFWDYLRINLEPAILASNDSHRWAQGRRRYRAMRSPRFAASCQAGQVDRAHRYVPERVRLGRRSDHARRRHLGRAEACRR